MFRSGKKFLSRRQKQRYLTDLARWAPQARRFNPGGAVDARSVANLGGGGIRACHYDKMERGWILLGMMGAGKSSIGRNLAEASHRPFLDTDLLLQNRLGRPVSQIFQVYGEATFRDHETSILRNLEPEPVVLATGGGIVLREENWTEMRRLGITVFLDAAFETLTERLARSKKKRPLLPPTTGRAASKPCCSSGERSMNRRT